MGANCLFVFGVAIPAFGYISSLRCEDTALNGAKGRIMSLRAKSNGAWQSVDGNGENEMRLLCHVPRNASQRQAGVRKKLFLKKTDYPN